MSSFLYPVASHWAGSAVTCRFKAFADNAPLAATTDTQPTYEIPNGTSEVRLIVTPTSTDYWETEIALSVSSSGALSVKASSAPFVRLKTAAANASRGTVVLVKVSRCKDVTTAATATPNVFDQLQAPPGKRRMKIDGSWVTRTVDEVANHRNMYGDWPPPDWAIHPLPDADFIDPQTPILPSGALNFATAPSLSIDVENVVLRIAGGRSPELFNVTWPKALAPQANAAPTPFLVYCRQTNKGNRYDEIGLFVGGELSTQPYPFNFDYADSGLFESLHYASAGPPPPGRQWLDPTQGPLRWVGAKGVPYQVARAGASVVTVMPCGRFGPEYGVLKDTEQLARILEEIQAFMFWRAGVADPPTTIGRTALSAFSSANYGLSAWLGNTKNLTGNFLVNTLKAVYFLDPPEGAVDGCIAAALKWANKASDARIRLYSQYRLDSHKRLLGMTGTSRLPKAPYVESALGNTRTAAALPPATWSKTFEERFGRPRTYNWSDVHHIIPGTMLTHALAQGDI